MIKIDKLKVEYPQEFSLDPISMNIEKGEIISLVGESGSGKTTFGKAVVGIIENNAQVSGEVLIDNINIGKISQKELKQMQMKDFSICFQNSQELLNPLLTVGEQLFEVFKKEYGKMI